MARIASGLAVFFVTVSSQTSMVARLFTHMKPAHTNLENTTLKKLGDLGKTEAPQSDHMHGITIRVPFKSDLRSVAAFAKQSFRDTFFVQAGYKEDEFIEFIEKEYHLDVLIKWRRENAKYGFFVAMKDNGECVGFSLVGGPSKLEHALSTPQSAEIMKIYIKQDMFGKGLSHKLMKHGLEWIKASPFTGDVMIAVWSQNRRAQNFYKRYGAGKVGEFEYPVGTTKDREFIFCIPRAKLADSK
eukprot:gnl/MRDRNA2_/MRDRNA2_66281_c0_seq2.p1 gnl/MRDRNA2_/MRDRNA2_66281_c0~~gnl/MRDRNA2_/MRDRNA2_66281_c0_seq2.p1  ORF type:complete len:243 (+),score=38.93 gnl/MRDRNA2_/MRDRNA2_66281_c0_seq2:77-805(+)